MNTAELGGFLAQQTNTLTANITSYLMQALPYILALMGFLFAIELLRNLISKTVAK